MRKTTTKIVAKKVVKSTKKPVKRPESVDDRLSEHLKQAEYHVIEAVKLFYGPRRPERVQTYQQRLEKAQELITGLYREELIRIRGPLKKIGKK